jgi:hypothetical protein
MSRAEQEVTDPRPWAEGEPVIILTGNFPDGELYGEVAYADDTVVLVDVGSDSPVGFWACDGTDSYANSAWRLTRPRREGGY